MLKFSTSLVILASIVQKGGEEENGQNGWKV